MSEGYGSAGSLRWWRRACIAAGLCVIVLSASAQAQPYAAAGGFMRPLHVAGPGIVGAIATASDGGVMQVVWADTTGVWRRPLFDVEAAPVQLAPAGSIRGLSATTAGGDMAVAWLERDLRTGRTRHSLTWRSRTVLLFETNLEIPMLIGEAAGTPWVLVAPRADGRATLTLYRLTAHGDLEEPISLHSTALNVTGIRAAGTDAELRGPALIAWLEGRTETSGFGADSEWFAYVMRAASPGATVPGARPTQLGLADVVDVRQAVAVGNGADGTVSALWLTVDGALELTTLAQGQDALAVVDRQAVGEAGRPVAFAGADTYWISDAFIRRGTIDARGRLGDVTSVVWSPVPIVEADLFATQGSSGAWQVPGSPAVSTVGADSVTTLAWYGREQGGTVTAYASDDSRPFEPGLGDEIARLMRWSPWTAGQEAIGQALTAVLAGIVVTLGLAPLLFVLALLAARARVGVSRPAVFGAMLGIATPLVVLVVVALRFLAADLSAAVSAGSAVRALPWLLLGALAGYLVARRSDNEAQLVTFIAASSAALVATTTLAFVTYHDWAAFVGLV